MAIGYSEWIERQMALPPTLHPPSLSALPHPTHIGAAQRERIDIWFRNALRAPDQLRQRVAFALSEIMVISQVGALGRLRAVAGYYDMLVATPSATSAT